MSHPQYAVALVAAIQRKLPVMVERAYTVGRSMIDRYPCQRPEQADGVEHTTMQTSGTASTYTPGAGFPAPDLGSQATGERDFGNYACTFTMTLKDMQKAALAGKYGVDRFVNIQLELIDGKISALLDAINTDIMTGNNVLAIDGLATRAIQDAAGFNIYQGINRTVNPNHACVVFDNAGVPRNVSSVLLTNSINTYKANLQKQVLSGWEGWTSAAMFSRLVQLDVGAHVNVAAEGVKYLGANAVVVDGIPIYPVAGWPANRIDFIDPNKPKRVGLEMGLYGQEWIAEVDKTAGSDVITVVIYSHQQLKLPNPRKNAFSIRDLV